MNGVPLAQYAQRLDRLELLVLTLAVLLAAILVVLVVTTLRAFRGQVILRDRKGNARLSLGMDEADDPAIMLWGRDAKSWAKIGCDSEGTPIVRLSDKTGRAGLSLEVSEGGPFLCMLNQDGDSVLSAGMTPDGVPGLVIYERSGKCRFQITLDESGGPYLVLFDGEDTRRLALGVSPTREPALVFFGKQGEERIAIGFDADGAPILHVLDDKGRIINQLHPANTDTSRI